ncbi:hypothetical protein UlMin_029336 [Ulmus minor]
MIEEYNVLINNKTWFLVELPYGRRPVESCKEEIEQIILLLNRSFSLKDIGDLNYFLGIEVKAVREGLHLSQKRYIEDLLKKSKMDNARSLPTPMISNLKLALLEGDPIPNATEYRSIVGGLHYKAVKRILRYLKGTLEEGILLRRSETLNLTGFCDADWGNDLCDRRSTTSYCIYLGRNVVSWSSKK